MGRVLPNSVDPPLPCTLFTVYQNVIPSFHTQLKCIPNKMVRYAVKYHIFVIKVCHVGRLSYALYGIRHQHSPLRQCLELPQLNLLKDQYFASLNLLIRGPDSPRGIARGWEPWYSM